MLSPIHLQASLACSHSLRGGLRTAPLRSLEMTDFTFRHEKEAKQKRSRKRWRESENERGGGTSGRASEGARETGREGAGLPIE